VKDRRRLDLAAFALSILGACTIHRTTPQPVALGSQAGETSGVVHAGCTFNGRQLLGEPGSTFKVVCPSGCVDRASLWGTDVYAIDSGICVAGIHAGAISKDGGAFAVRLDVGQTTYRGSSRNGVTSADDGSYGGSFTVAAVGRAPAPPPEAIQAGCTFDSTQIRDAYGTAHLVSCPPGCARAGNLWGTDVYSGDLSICKAAIHSGIISDGAGGNVVVVLDGRQPAFRGSLRNQVRSGDYGRYSSSFLVQPAQ
jgi:LCCL domain